ncbi:MAG: ARPP-1 family domain-containing protein [Promethearchaeota archaeon]
MSKIETIREFAKRITTMNGMEIGTPLVLEEISFVPIVKHEVPFEERDYLTLSEALERGICKIIDKGTEVAHISFQNTGDIPILIEEGEIFQGKGTQDRICIGTVMVEPGVIKDISVKCVHAPHPLSSGASFGYGGKASRGMLNEMRALKYSNAMIGTVASNINQSRIWSRVSEEMANENSVSDPTQYTQGIEARRKRAKKHSNSITFPKNTIGFVVIDHKGEIKGVEVHRSPHNFKLRKDGIFESLETNISWKSVGKGPFPNSQEKAKNLFKKLSELEEGKDVLKQVEIDGLVINSEGLKGEAFASEFYSAKCPSCKNPKPRQKACPHCGFLERSSKEFTFMSLY